MAKICPVTNSVVLYLECLECEDKVCRKIQVKEKGRTQFEKFIKREKEEDA